MDKSEYIVSSADVDIYISFDGGTPIKIETGASMQWRLSQSVNPIYAISYKDPISIKAINASYTGSLDIQSGEWNAILNNYAATHTNPVASLISSNVKFSISVTYNHRNPIQPYAATTTWTNALFSDENGSITANDPQTIVSLEFQGTGIIRNTTLLPATNSI